MDCSVDQICAVFKSNREEPGMQLHEAPPPPPRPLRVTCSSLWCPFHVSVEASLVLTSHPCPESLPYVTSFRPAISTAPNLLSRIRTLLLSRSYCHRPHQSFSYWKVQFSNVRAII